jgi:superfamily II DNA or RNA helicase
VPHATLTGKTPAKRRQEILDRFRAGELPVLIAGSKVLGFGMNLQSVGSMIFSGWTYGYEAYYQAVRRAYRHGQTRSAARPPAGRQGAGGRHARHDLPQAGRARGGHRGDGG